MPSGSASSEDDIVRALSGLFGSAAARRIATIGIGDDAAVLRSLREPLVWTIDTSVEGVHFLRRWLSLEQIGERSFHAAASDLAAMGAKPVAALSNLTIPRSSNGRAAVEIARGQARAARALLCPMVGGNLSRGSEISVTTTVLGTARRPLLRSGACPGDELWLLGDVGLAGAGREWLSRRRSAGARKDMATCVAAFRFPRARIREGQSLIGPARAAIDVSDGLAVDARRLAKASRVRVVLDEQALSAALRPELLHVASALGRSPLDLALYGGEDYALLASGPARRRPRGAKVIGRIDKGRGTVLARAGGQQRQLESGFDHFASKTPSPVHPNVVSPGQKSR